MLQRLILGLFFFLSALLINAQAPSAPGKPLPPGPMQAKVRAACTSCHNTARITQQHMSREEWVAQLEKMEGLGAVIADEDREGILQYLTANFGPVSDGDKKTNGEDKDK